MKCILVLALFLLGTQATDVGSLSTQVDHIQKLVGNVLRPIEILVKALENDVSFRQKLHDVNIIRQQYVTVQESLNSLTNEINDIETTHRSGKEKKRLIQEASERFQKLKTDISKIKNVAE